MKLQATNVRLVTRQRVRLFCSMNRKTDPKYTQSRWGEEVSRATASSLNERQTGGWLYFWNKPDSGNSLLLLGWSMFQSLSVPDEDPAATI